jgi:phosphomannomutase
MLQVGAIIGGEGNGGVMLPNIHIGLSFVWLFLNSHVQGRDAPVALALVISLLSQYAGTISQLKQSLPQWEIVKMKVAIEKDVDIDPVSFFSKCENWPNF